MYLLLLLAVIALFQCLDALGPGELPEIPGVCYSQFTSMLFYKGRSEPRLSLLQSLLFRSVIPWGCVLDYPILPFPMGPEVLSHTCSLHLLLPPQVPFRSGL